MKNAMVKYRIAEEKPNGELSAFRTIYYSKVAAYNANAMLYKGRHVVVKDINGKLIK